MPKSRGRGITGGEGGRGRGRERSILGRNRPLHRVHGEGPCPCRVMLIGEKPGRTEAEQGRPFIGLTGSMVSEIYLPLAGMKREEVYITNLVKEFTEYGKPTQEEIDRDSDELNSEFIAVAPIVVGLLGTYAVEAVLSGERAELERVHGIPTRIPNDPCIYLPMYHPAAALYSVETMPHIIEDFKVLARLAKGEYDWLSREDQWAGREIYRSLECDSVDVHGPSAADTEGSRKRPWCMTYSVQPGISMMVKPGQPATFDGLVWLHNSLHDLQVLAAMGIVLEDEQFIDTMVLAYLLCLEPQGLKLLAYRHCGMSMMSYDDVIMEADRARATEYLVGVDAVQWEVVQPYVIIEGGKAKVHKPQSINQRVRRILNDYNKREGTEDPVDPRKRWGGVEDYIKQEVVEALGEMPEATLDDVDPESAKNYACRDSDATIRLGPILERKINEMGLGGVSEIDHHVIPMVNRMQEVGAPIAPAPYWERLIEKCDDQMGRAKYRILQATGAEINPDSGDQVAALLYGQLKMIPPKMTESGARGATNDKSLEQLVGQHPCVDMVLDYREASKVRSSFASVFLRASRRDETRIHCNMRITRVSSGRLAATNPNLLAIPVRSALGKEVRGGFSAPDGRVLGDWDLDQIEMRVLAHESRDLKLVELFAAGDKDIHRETAASMFGIRPEEVRAEQRYAAKRVGFGVITGITEYGLVDQMALARARRPDGQNWTKDDCRQMIEEWFKVYVGAKEYLEACKEEARQTGISRDMWGRVRYLPGVWSKVKWVAEEAGRQSHSHKIQAGAQGIIKRAMWPIWKDVCKWRLGGADPLLQVHDELLFEMDDDKEWQQVVDQTVIYHLCNTTKLIVPIKAKGGFGRSWAEVKE